MKWYEFILLLLLCGILETRFEGLGVFIFIVTIIGITIKWQKKKSNTLTTQK